MKKNWNNPTLTSLNLGKTKDTPSIYPSFDINCTCCGKSFYQHDAGLGGNPTNTKEWQTALNNCFAHEETVHPNGCSA